MQKITPYKIKKAFLYLKHFGLREFMNHLFERLEPEDVPYDGWFRSHSPSREELEKQRKSKIKEGPLFSLVVPAYCTRERFFREMIDSVILSSSVYRTSAQVFTMHSARRKSACGAMRSS